MKALIAADWPAPNNIKAFVTTREGGVSIPPFDGFNLAMHVEDNPEHVEHNRQILNDLLASHASKSLAPLVWGTQVHGVDVVELPLAAPSNLSIEADSFYTQKANQPCLVMTADCLPVVFCSKTGDEVAVAHAGWRGLANGVLEQTLKQFKSPASEIMAWLGPAIGADQFEVGPEVRSAFLSFTHDLDVLGKIESAFTATPNAHSNSIGPGSHKHKYLADIFALARIRLNAFGISAIYGGGDCTVSQPDKYYSYRRDGKTGRMATLVWLD